MLLRNKRGVIEKPLQVIIPIVLIIIISGSLFYWMFQQTTPTPKNKDLLATELATTLSSVAANPSNKVFYFTKATPEHFQAEMYEYDRFLYSLTDKEVIIELEGGDPLPTSYPIAKNKHHIIKQTEKLSPDLEEDPRFSLLGVLQLTKDGNELSLTKGTTERNFKEPRKYDCPPFDKVSTQAIIVDSDERTRTIARELLRQASRYKVPVSRTNQELSISKRAEQINPADFLISLKSTEDKTAKAFVNIERIEENSVTACHIINTFAEESQIAIIPVNPDWIPSNDQKQLLKKVNNGVLLEIPSSLLSNPARVEQLIAKGLEAGLENV